jgi:membrane-bound lytic murein transglycosylase D
MKSYTVGLRLLSVLSILLFLISGCSTHLKHTGSPSSDPSNASPAIESSRAPYPKSDKSAFGPNAAATLEEPTEKDAMSEEPLNAEPQNPPKSIQSNLDDALSYCDVAQQFWQKGELENALDALDQAYALILDADTTDEPKLMQQKEDLRFLISKRILEIYASRNIVVTGNHNAIPLVLNRHVQSEIDNFTFGRERDFFVESYRRSGRYRPMIVQALKEAGLPTELSWLPLIESGYKVNALSSARALGLWQFIPSTGYKFGLSRDKYIDERLDPWKATTAAIAYLKELHQIFGDWTTVLAAYNCGEGRVLRVIREQNINYLDNFWDLYERLPYETARYVPRFLATLHIVENLDRYNLAGIEVEAPPDFEELEIDKQVHLKHVAMSIDSSEVYLNELNPELRYRIVPPEGYKLRIPPGTADLLVARLTDIPESKPPTRAVVYHRVRRGETLSMIARKYRTSVRSIMRANNLRSSHYIVAGRLLKIPQRGYSYQQAQLAEKPVSQATHHKVSRGDNLWNIAKRYGTTTTRIQEINNLKTTELSVGQVLKLPGAEQESISAEENMKVYRVKPGDSPFAIAQQYNMPLNRFLRLNQLSSRSKIYPGQQLYIE